jgi:three-Cys-motif partner protein
MADPYFGREQTRAKHFILKHYLQALAFKVLTFSDVAYVDGFSGPWETKTNTFEDSSFMIALSVLRDAQSNSRERRRVRCFFSESDAEAFTQLAAAVAPFHKPDEGFEIKTYCGRFEDAVSEISKFVGDSFALIFIDPTGWTGYPLERIKSLFMPRKCEVLINFMYDFVNRFANSDDQDTIDSLNPILGGPGWRDRLDPRLSRGLAVEKLFRGALKSAGKFSFVVSTKIDKSTADRPHFFIAYGTKEPTRPDTISSNRIRRVAGARESSRRRKSTTTRGANWDGRPVREYRRRNKRYHD